MTTTSAAREGRPVGPKRVQTSLFEPGRSVFHIAFSADLADDPFKRLRDLPKALDPRIVGVRLSEVEGTRGSWSVFMSCGGSSTSESLRRALEDAGFGGLEIEGGGEFMIDELFFPLVDSSGERVMLMTQRSFQTMLAAISEQFGSGGQVISYQEGLAMGARTVAAWQGKFRGDLRSFVLEGLKVYSVLGVGRCEMVEADFQSLRFVARIARNIECEGRRATKPNSQWVRGHLCGAASTSLGVPMRCVETKCMSVGDPYCEFELTKSKGR